MRLCIETIVARQADGELAGLVAKANARAQAIGEAVGRLERRQAWEIGTASEDRELLAREAEKLAEVSEELQRRVGSDLSD